MLDPTSQYSEHLYIAPSGRAPSPSRTVRLEPSDLPSDDRCTRPQPFATAETTRVAIDGRIDFLVYIPTSYRHGSRKASSPLLVGIAGKNAPCINTLNALFTSAAAAEYILVAPCLTATSYDDIGGTADTHSEPAMSEIVHQLRNVITSVKRSLCVDARRIFFAGFGSGGALAEMAASRLPDLIRAIASVGGVFDGATRSHQSLIHFHGTCDDAVPFLGSPDRPSVVEHMLRWAVRASCEQPPTSTVASDNHQNLVWSCPNSVQVELIISLGARHGLPASVYIPGDIHRQHGWIKEDSFDTTDQIVGFFSGRSHDWNSSES